MFHSNDPSAGRVMAASKAMSGGPIYLSDEPQQFDSDAIRPLCYQDGLLLRPLAPAAPVAEDLFFQEEDPALYRVSAPLGNHCAAFAIYNLQGEPRASAPKFTTMITPAQYANASVLMQPYPGKWAIPEEGLLCYDIYERKAAKMGEGLPVEITGFGDKLIQACPIRNGWAVIGRTDKYLPGAAVDAVSGDRASLKLRLHERGPFALWLAEGAPKADGIKFVAQGGGLYFSDLPIDGQGGEITVTRIEDTKPIK
jgi:hypothetical protein